MRPGFPARKYAPSNSDGRQSTAQSQTKLATNATAQATGTTSGARIFGLKAVAGMKADAAPAGIERPSDDIPSDAILANYRAGALRE
jgi:hypothetical protein